MKTPLRIRRSRRGMVLVIMLAMIVLVTIAVMAFFTRASSNRTVESSRSSKTEAALLSRSAEDYLVGRFYGEITTNSRSSFSDGIYTPLASTNLVPVRAVSSAISAADTNFSNLLRQSVPSSDARASSHNTSVASRNGRVVNPARWNAPFLLSGGGFKTSSELPNWIYVTKDAGFTNTPGPNVIGRFAYNIYDIGGLLNVNTAGFPTTLSATSVATLKASQAGVGLTNGIPGLNSASVNDDLVKFRSASSASTGDSDYLSRVDALTRDGYTSSFAPDLKNTVLTHTNNSFTTRQDLVRYARTANSTMTNALPLLTQFSYSINTPEPRFDAPNAVNPIFSSVQFSSAATITHYDDGGKIQNYSVKNGDAAVQAPFSLAKLAWVGPRGPNAAAFSPGINTSQQATAIRYCFGLEWNNTQERWDYVESRNSEELMTLGEVATARREPNFFEILKAGIASGSIGKSYGTAATSDLGYSATPIALDLQANSNLHILRIGANIIDSADSDNFPTIIGYSVGGTTLEKAGVEDLPYIFNVLMQTIRKLEVVQGHNSFVSYDSMWVPTFINPHREVNTPTEQPDAVRVEIVEGSTLKVIEAPGKNIFKQNIPAESKELSDITTPGNPRYQGTIDIPKSEYAKFREGPKANRALPGDGNRMDELTKYIDPNTGAHLIAANEATADVEGFRIFSYQTDYKGAKKTLPPVPNANGVVRDFYKNPHDENQGFMIDSRDIADSNGASSSGATYIQFEGLNIVLRYKTPKGNWKTYAIIGGDENIPQSGINGQSQSDYDSGNVSVYRFSHWHSPGREIRHLDTVYNLTTYDPRTLRGGPRQFRYWKFEKLPQLTRYGNADTGAPMATYAQAGNGTAQPVAANLYSGNIGTENSNFPDPDGFYRPTDGSINPATSNPYLQINPSDATLLNVTSPSRPAILQRPFRSVGELGYVFRDDPWKTLNFFSADSGDGALLQLFSVSDVPPVSNDKVSLYTRQLPVLSAVLNDVSREPENVDGLTSTMALTLATALRNYNYGSTTGLPVPTMLWGLSDLPKFMASAEATAAYPKVGPASDGIKYRRESFVRGLAGALQSRTWNVLIDVVAQTGRFASGAGTNPGDFVVEAEDRNWFSVALDRYQATVVRSQNESVNE